jgi:uncharacterized membrane protein YcaP (DUF421 family)
MQRGLFMRVQQSRDHRLERMDQIKFAIFEASGRISIIPKRKVLAGGAKGRGRRTP